MVRVSLGFGVEEPRGRSCSSDALTVATFSAFFALRRADLERGDFGDLSGFRMGSL